MPLSKPSPSVEMPSLSLPRGESSFFDDLPGTFAAGFCQLRISQDHLIVSVTLVQGNRRRAGERSANEPFRAHSASPCIQSPMCCTHLRSYGEAMPGRAASAARRTPA